MGKLNRQEVTDIEQYRYRKRRAGSFRWVLIALFFLACTCAGYFFAISSFFEVDAITVRGNQLISEERLQQLSGIQYGQSIFAVDTLYAERWLELEPLVAAVTVERQLPRTITIEVSERQPVAVLSTGRAFIQIDEVGYVLRRLRVLDNMNLPLISGVEEFPSGILPGSYIEGEKMGVALAVLSNLPATAQGVLAEINVADGQKIKLYTQSGIELRLGGPTDLAEKYVLGISLVNDAQVNGYIGNISYIDVSSTERPVIFPKTH